MAKFDRVTVKGMLINEEGELCATVMDYNDCMRGVREKAEVKIIKINPKKLFKTVEYGGMGHADSGYLHLARYVENLDFLLTDISDGLDSEVRTPKV